MALTLHLGPSLGRLYEGFYSAKATEIISELEKRGQLTRRPSGKQMREFALIIYEEMTRYFYDSRIKRIETLDRIITYLVSEDIMEDSPKAYLTLSDIYGFSSARISSTLAGPSSYGRLPGNRYFRPFGYDVGLVLVGFYRETRNSRDGSATGLRHSTEFDSLWQVTDRDTFDLSQEYSIVETYQGENARGIRLYFDYGRPYGWHWQFITESAFEILNGDTLSRYLFGSLDTGKKGSVSRTRNRIWRGQLITSRSLTVYGEIQYFLDSRTYFQLSQTTAISDRKYLIPYRHSVYTDSGYVVTTRYYDEIFKELRSTVDLNATYFLTPRLSINGRIRFVLDHVWDVEYRSRDGDGEQVPAILRPWDRTSSHTSFRLFLNYYLF